MAKPRSTEAKLTRLRLLATEPMSPELVEEVRKGLADPSNLVVAAAAGAIGDRAIRELTADLVAAFDRLMIEPEKSDKQCRGKIALVEALNKLDFAQPEIFLRGIVHVQEPGWGQEKDQDAAGPLRAHCAFGLARLNLPDRLHHLTDLLHDKDKRARAGAARALGGAGSLAAIPLLRFKARLGDGEPEVMGECFSALLALDPAESLSFVSRFLSSASADVPEAAIFALAEIRSPDTFAILKDFWPRTPPGLEETVLLAIAMLRLPPALDFLINRIAHKDPHSRAALSALAIHRHHGKIRERVAAAVVANGDPAVGQWFQKKFPED
jgi:HEAT repeat protein